MGLARTVRFVLDHPFNRGRPVSALSRYVGWQIGSRLASGPIGVAFVDDIKLFATPGMTGATGNIYCGLQEFVDMGFTLHFLRPGDLFVDVGANVGSYSLLAAAAGADVIAFEPGEAFEPLARNVTANGLSVQCRREAVGDVVGTLRFTVGKDTTNRAAHLMPDAPSIEVAMTTLDAAIDRAPTLIKIDVEGFEDAVLAGGERTIRSAQALIMEGPAPWMTERMAAYGFHMIDYDPLSRKVSAPTIGRGQAIFVREDTSERLMTAPKYRVGHRLI